MDYFRALLAESTAEMPPGDTIVIARNLIALAGTMKGGYRCRGDSSHWKRNEWRSHSQVHGYHSFVDANTRFQKRTSTRFLLQQQHEDTD